MDPGALLDRKLAYVMLRFTLGLSIFMHGMVRLPHLSAFAEDMVKLFVQTPLPAFIVRPSAFSECWSARAPGFMDAPGLDRRRTHDGRAVKIFAKSWG
jgi:hypothetical protein